MSRRNKTKNLELLEEEWKCAIPDFYADKKIRISCLLCRHLSTTYYPSGGGAGYGYSLMCRHDQENKSYSDRCLEDLEQPLCGEKFSLDRGFVKRCASEYIPCLHTECSGKMEMQTETFLRRSYDPEGHMASGGSWGCSITGFVCKFCGTAYDTAVITRKVYKIVWAYFERHSIPEGDWETSQKKKAEEE